MTVVDGIAAVLLLAGCGFYLAGTVGLLRLPDSYSRLHALTKADNVGLMLVCAGLAVRAASLRVALLLGVVWLLALVASTLSAHLLARRTARGEDAGDEDVRDEGRRNEDTHA
ncbi:monovalent cation/H(+) antiporter subunit G [Luteimonas aestuarii]|uniref:Monovalent cation/H(+) antiporter subunit G n=1 Tax=Luteimonas aestuarii TaxID=453837 RepID=A0A4R5TKE6_9GAMM|nr:monovalent cation/H(+) antiporter subunit G [Luteimonas aestuarii]TDK23019.1 monovalent cation/H(+) antiporter subunit G [Luteimonas aestuarii]